MQELRSEISDKIDNSKISLATNVEDAKLHVCSQVDDVKSVILSNSTDVKSSINANIDAAVSSQLTAAVDQAISSQVTAAVDKLVSTKTAQSTYLLQADDHQILPTSEDLQTTSENSIEWSSVVNRNKTKYTSSSAGRVNDVSRRRIIGASKTSSAKVASASVGQWHVFIGRVNKDTDVNSIKEFLEENGISVLEVKKLTAKQTWQEKSAAFHVSVALRFKDAIMNADIWPDNVEVRDWYFKPKQ